MRPRWRRLAGVGVAGATVAMTLCAGYLKVRHPTVLSIESLGMAGVLGAGIALLTAWWTQHLSRRLLARLAERIGALRENPALHGLHDLDRLLPHHPELAPVQEQMELWMASYRRALAAVVQAREMLEDGPAAARRDDDNPERPTPAAASSRQRMVARLTPTLHWIAATPPLLQFLDCTLSALVARSFLDLAHREDVAELGRTLHEALRDGEAHNITFRVVTSEGQERYLQTDVMTSYTEKGDPLNLRCHFIDVTQRIRTEQELHRRTAELSEANARLQKTNEDLQRLKESYGDLYNHAPVLYFGLDANDRFVAVNETMLRTLGYSREELFGRPYTRLLTLAGREVYRKNPGLLHRTGELETQWVKRDGSVIDVWIDTTTIRDESGAFVRSRGAARDVTERKRLANALRDKANELSHANTHLRRINQQLEDFTQVVSHDLKEPLRTLEAFSNFLSQDYGPTFGAEGQQYLHHLIQASRRLGTLIDELLALSRAGRVIDTPRAFSWDEVLQTSFGDLHDLIQRQQAEVRVDGPLPPVCGDPARVSQLLSNLIRNGLKYNQSPRPEVVIGTTSIPKIQNTLSKTQTTTSQPDFVTLYVRDNGIGIDPADHERIFRMFQRLHQREDIEGAGAGLTICQRIVEAHGGRIWVESRPGQGATFYFTLRRLAASVPASPAASLAEEPTAHEPASAASDALA